MRITMLKSKIHRATVTDANLNYEGSVSIDPQLCEAARLLPFERVDIYNCSNGARFSTYVIYGKPGEVCLNGAAARHVHVGDLVIIAAYAEFEQIEAMEHKPSLVMVNEQNKIKELHSDVVQRRRLDL